MERETRKNARAQPTPLGAREHTDHDSIDRGKGRSDARAGASEPDRPPRRPRPREPPTDPDGVGMKRPGRGPRNPFPDARRSSPGRAESGERDVDAEPAERLDAWRNDPRNWTPVLERGPCRGACDDDERKSPDGPGKSGRANETDNPNVAGKDRRKEEDGPSSKGALCFRCKKRGNAFATHRSWCCEDCNERTRRERKPSEYMDSRGRTVRCYAACRLCKDRPARCMPGAGDLCIPCYCGWERSEIL